MRFTYINNLRVLATIMVIFIHVSSMYISSMCLTPVSGDYLPYQFTHTFCSCAVAIFIMISGALLLDREDEISFDRVAKHYIPRIAMALIIFGLPMCMIELLMTNPSVNLLTLMGKSICNLITGQCWTHMWYLYMLIGLYLITPLLHRFILTSSTKDHTWLAIVLLIMGFGIPNLSSYTSTPFSNYLTIPSFIATYYFGFYVKRYILDKQYATHIAWIVIAFYIGWCYFQTRTGQMQYGPQYFPSVLVATAFFCIAHRHPLLPGVNTFLSQYCFCIYIIHAIILHVMFKAVHIENILQLTPIFNIIIVVTITFLTSLFIAILLKKIAPFKKIL